MSKPDAANSCPRTWHAYSGCEESPPRQAVEREIRDATFAPWPDGTEPTLDEKYARYGDLYALFQEASEGLLRGENWKPVIRVPTLWEIILKWDLPDIVVRNLRNMEISEDSPNEKKLKVDTLEFRGYFYEPKLSPKDTVLALAHIKEIWDDEEKTRQEQNYYIDKAGSRITKSTGCSWGIDDDEAPLAPRKTNRSLSDIDCALWLP